MAKKPLKETTRYAAAKRQVTALDKEALKVAARRKELKAQRHVAYREMRAALKEMRLKAKEEAA